MLLNLGLPSRMGISRKLRRKWAWEGVSETISLYPSFPRSETGRESPSLPGLAHRLWEQLQEAPPPGMWLGCFTSHTPLTAPSFPNKDPVLDFLSLSPGSGSARPRYAVDTLQHSMVYGVKC